MASNQTIDVSFSPEQFEELRSTLSGIEERVMSRIEKLEKRVDGENAELKRLLEIERAVAKARREQLMSQ